MRAPKLLPWLARKAGVSMPRAEELWRESVRYAYAHAGKADKSEYWKTANERLRHLLKAEAAAPIRLRMEYFAPQSLPYWFNPFVAAREANTFYRSAWKNWASFCNSVCSTAPH